MLILLGIEYVKWFKNTNKLSSLLVSLKKKFLNHFSVVSVKLSTFPKQLWLRILSWEPIRHSKFFFLVNFSRSAFYTGDMLTMLHLDVPETFSFQIVVSKSQHWNEGNVPEYLFHSSKWNHLFSAGSFLQF